MAVLRDHKHDFGWKRVMTAEKLSLTNTIFFVKTGFNKTRAPRRVGHITKWVACAARSRTDGLAENRRARQVGRVVPCAPFPGPERLARECELYRMRTVLCF
jgi:hypothetical protein